MLGLDNPLHIAFVLVLVLLVFGAKRLPEMGKSMGAGLRGFKESISGEEPTAHLDDAHAQDPVRADELHTTPTAIDESTTKPSAEHTPMQSVA
jgi:sec-independent protein translocase protein TatA